MAIFEMNKGVGRKVEFQGLTAQYLFLLVGGLGGIFLTFVLLFMAGAPQGTCILFAFLAAMFIIWGTFYLNRRFGEHGLMKRMAARQHPRRILHRRAVRRLLNSSKF